LSLIFSQELAKYSPVPVLNALSSLWHPTQTLADLLTLYEHAHLFDSSIPAPSQSPDAKFDENLPALPKLTIAWLGDSTNVLHDMLVTYPRLGHKLRVAVPPGAAYKCPEPVWDLVKQLDCEKDITWTHDPREAVNGANVVVTDTWYVPYPGNGQIADMKCL
jgi:ornithine carbamoyltransferase